MSDRARPAVDAPVQPFSRRHLLRASLALAAVGTLSRPLVAAAQGGAGTGLRFFQIGTGTTGGTYFLIGGVLANAISNPPGSRPCDRGGSCGVPGLIVVAQSTSGAVENVEGMRAGRLESGLVQADIAHAALHGEGAFADKPAFRGLRSIANLYAETIHLVVRRDSGIAKPEDLKGKRVALGEQGSGTLVTARAILTAYGLSEKALTPVYLSPGSAGDRLTAGTLDGFFIVGGYPLPAVADLAQRVEVALVPFEGPRADRLKRRLPFYSETLVEDGVYTGVSATRSLNVGAQWLTVDTMPEELIYGVTAALWNARTRTLLDEGHPRGSSIRLDQALAGLAVPLHPGAERFYREAGFPVETAALPPPPAKAGPDGPDVPVPALKPRPTQ